MQPKPQNTIPYKTLFAYPQKKPPGGRLFLLLNFLEDLALAGGLVEFLEFERAIHFLLVLAGKEDVPGRALNLDQIYL
jgi:hypothetical protein